jgi:hypothetical protein
VKLTAADINAGHVSGARLQGAVGEAASGGAHVEHVRAAQVEAVFFEENDKLFATPADETGRLIQDEDHVVRVFPARFIEPLCAAAHPASHDQRAGLRARRGEAALHQEFVKTPAGAGHRDLWWDEGPGHFFSVHSAVNR